MAQLSCTISPHYAIADLGVSCISSEQAAPPPAPLLPLRGGPTPGPRALTASPQLRMQPTTLKCPDHQPVQPKMTLDYYCFVGELF